jgi:UDP-glucose 4-epimerase
MTRFVMTLEQSVNLIEHAIINGKTGDIVIPRLVSMKLPDLLQIFSEKYNKPVKVTGLRPGEKLLESLINITQSYRMETVSNYTHIRSVLVTPDIQVPLSDIHDYNSNISPLTKDELNTFLSELGLI